jgi:hypothetical protein
MSPTLASNPNTPPATLEALAADANCGVRRAVGGNPNTPPRDPGGARPHPQHAPEHVRPGNRRHRVLTVSSVHTTMIGQRHGVIVYKEASRVRVIG